MICIKCDQNKKKPKKPKFWTFGVFLGFLKLKNLVLWKPFSSPAGDTRRAGIPAVRNAVVRWLQSVVMYEL